MPTYRYKFSDDTIVEVFQTIREEAYDTLFNPNSDKVEKVKRIPYLPSVVLKGSGFAKNDKGNKK